MKFVDIKNDVAFRKIFGNENRTEVLVSFLNAVLCLENGRKITEVTVLTPYQLPELRGGKVTIVDVKAKDQNGKTYIVEMQVAHVDGFNKRVLYYASKSYSSQISRGDDYENLMPTLFIGILDFIATKSENFISRHIVKNAETGEHFITDIEFNFIELPKFNKQADELNSIIDQWVFFIKNAENLDVIPESVEDKGLKEAYEEADKHNWTSQELEAYDKIFMREQDDRGRITFALKEGIKEGMIKGREEGMKKGREEGMIKGKEEGRKEGAETIAKSLFKTSLSNSEIAEHTGLTVEQIEALRKEK